MLKINRKGSVAAVILLTLAIIAIFITVSFFDDPITDHDCCGSECSICMRATASKQTVSSCLILIMLGACAVLGTEASLTRLDRQECVGSCRTPVTLRVKLLN